MWNGVSSCGGRLVTPIIGRFCGYRTSGRSPLSNGRVTVSSANAPLAKSPVASAARPARCISSRRLSIGFLRSSLFWPVITGPRRQNVAAKLRKSIHAFAASPSVFPRRFADAKPRPRGATGVLCPEKGVRSENADVDSAPAVTERCRHQAVLVAAAIAAAEEAEAEAGMPVMVMMRLDHRHCRSRGRGQRGHAERGSGNEGEGHFAEHVLLLCIAP